MKHSLHKTLPTDESVRSESHPPEQAQRKKGMQKPLRVLYVAGPGDVAGTFAHWRRGVDDPLQVALTYSGQFFDLCRELDLDALVIASHRRPADECDGRIRVLHRPVPLENRSGWRYHVGQVWHGLRVVREAARFRADVVVAANLTHWFALWPLRWLGIACVPSLHCVLRAKYRTPGRIQRWLDRLNRGFFRRCDAVLSISRDVSEQVRELTAAHAPPIAEFLPTYRPECFADSPPPPPDRPAPGRPFRVLYAGRIRQSKGVFDLLDVADHCRRALGDDGVRFDLCGDGEAMAELREMIPARGLDSVMRVHGHQTRDQMRDHFAAAHVVIAPTTTEFIEGFNKVVAEAVLLGRPCITSRVCPALDYVRDAIVEAEPDDAASYAEAVIELARDPDLYQRKQASTALLREPFLDPDRSWAAALRRTIAAVCEEPSIATAAGPPPGAGPSEAL